MARISEYESSLSIKATSVIDRILKDASITPTDIEAFQQRYGISTQELSRLSGHAEAQISQWRNHKRDIPERVQQHFKLLFAEFKKQLGAQETFFSEKLKDANAFLEKVGVPKSKN